MTSPYGQFLGEIKNYLDDKGLEHQISDGRSTIHVKVKDVTKKFWLEVLLPEMRTTGELYNLQISGTTFFSHHVYVRFFGRMG